MKVKLGCCYENTAPNEMEITRPHLCHNHNDKSIIMLLLVIMNERKKILERYH